MLTVKHVKPDGCEEIHPAVRVHTIPRGVTVGDRGLVSVENDRGEIKHLGSDDSGIFYVMNELGRTIAKYDLGGIAVGAQN